jgi:hypothetical protein
MHDWQSQSHGRGMGGRSPPPAGWPRSATQLSSVAIGPDEARNDGNSRGVGSPVPQAGGPLKRLGDPEIGRGARRGAADRCRQGVSCGRARAAYTEGSLPPEPARAFARAARPWGRRAAGATGIEGKVMR